MGFLRRMARDYLIFRFMGGGRGRSRRSSYPLTTRSYGRSRSRSPYLLAPRRRSRTQVRVGGCCLPIPLGFLLAGSAAGRLASRRGR